MPSRGSPRHTISSVDASASGLASNKEGEPGHVVGRLRLLAEVVQQQLVVVAINLDQKDDDQLIFETLNDRGTPLLAADLIKNMVFQQGEDLGADVGAWGEKYWADFDEDWWRQEVQQGRLFRSRIDLFLQYWLTMRMQDEIPAEKIFARVPQVRVAAPHHCREGNSAACRTAP